MTTTVIRAASAALARMWDRLVEAFVDAEAMIVLMCYVGAVVLFGVAIYNAAT